MQTDIKIHEGATVSARDARRLAIQQALREQRRAAIGSAVDAATTDASSSEGLMSLLRQRGDAPTDPSTRPSTNQRPTVGLSGDPAHPFKIDTGEQLSQRNYAQIRDQFQQENGRDPSMREDQELRRAAGFQPYMGMYGAAAPVTDPRGDSAGIMRSMSREAAAGFGEAKSYPGILGPIASGAAPEGSSLTDLASIFRERRLRPISPGSQAVNDAPTLGALAQLAQEHPGLFIQGVGDVTARSYGQVVPGLLGQMAAGAATGGAGYVAANAANSFGVEYANSWLDALEEAIGPDAVQDENALAAAIADPRVMGFVNERATARAAAISTMDTGASAGMSLIMPTTPTRGLARTVGRFGLQTSVGMAGESAGEAAAQFSAGQPIDPKEIALEGIAGVGEAVTEAATITAEQTKRAFEQRRTNRLRESWSTRKGEYEAKRSAQPTDAAATDAAPAPDQAEPFDPSTLPPAARAAYERSQRRAAIDAIVEEEQGQQDQPKPKSDLEAILERDTGAQTGTQTAPSAPKTEPTSSDWDNIDALAERLMGKVPEQQRRRALLEPLGITVGADADQNAPETIEQDRRLMTEKPVFDNRAQEQAWTDARQEAETRTLRRFVAGRTPMGEANGAQAQAGDESAAGDAGSEQAARPGVDSPLSAGTERADRVLPADQERQLAERGVQQDKAPGVDQGVEPMVGDRGDVLPQQPGDVASQRLPEGGRNAGDVTPTTPAPSQAPKQPWEMTKAEWNAKLTPTAAATFGSFQHRNFVLDALADGADVPPHVIAEYPGIVEQADRVREQAAQADAITRANKDKMDAAEQARKNAADAAYQANVDRNIATLNQHDAYLRDEAWKKRKTEYVTYKRGGAKQLQEGEHRDAVARALSEGKPVPAEVLADYPDLAPNSSVSPDSSPAAPPSQAEAPAVNYADDIPINVAVGAFTNTSHTPEKRGQARREEYAATLKSAREQLDAAAKTDEQKRIADAEFARYREGMKSRTLAYLNALSRTASSMITGPANFPVERNRKAGAVADKRGEELRDFDKRARAAMLRAVNAAATPEMRSNEETGRIEQITAKFIERSRDGFNAMSKQNFVGKLERAAKNGETQAVARALQMLREEGQRRGKPLFVNRASIWKLADVATEAVQAEASAPTGEQEHAAYTDGTRVVRNYDDDRLRIFFPGKPSDAQRTALKSRGFKWSPANGAWQRQNTQAAVFAADDILLGFGKQKNEAPPAAAAVAPTSPSAPAKGDSLAEKIADLREKITAETNDRALDDLAERAALLADGADRANRIDLVNLAQKYKQQAAEKAAGIRTLRRVQAAEPAPTPKPPSTPDPATTSTPAVPKAAQDYAAKFGVVLTVEKHGIYGNEWDYVATPENAHWYPNSKPRRAPVGQDPRNIVRAVAEEIGTGESDPGRINTFRVTQKRKDQVAAATTPTPAPAIDATKPDIAAAEARIEERKAETAAKVKAAGAPSGTLTLTGGMLLNNPGAMDVLDKINTLERQRIVKQTPVKDRKSVPARVLNTLVMRDGKLTAASNDARYSLYATDLGIDADRIAEGQVVGVDWKSIEAVQNRMTELRKMNFGERSALAGRLGITGNPTAERLAAAEAGLPENYQREEDGVEVQARAYETTARLLATRDSDAIGSESTTNLGIGAPGLAERIDAIAERARQRIQERAKKAGKSVTLNAGLNPVQLAQAARDTLDLSIVVAAKALNAKVFGGRSLTRIIEQTAREAGKTLDDTARRLIRRNVRRILTEAAANLTGDPDFKRRAELTAKVRELEAAQESFQSLIINARRRIETLSTSTIPTKERHIATLEIQRDDAKKALTAPTMELRGQTAEGQEAILEQLKKFIEDAEPEMVRRREQQGTLVFEAKGPTLTVNGIEFETWARASRDRESGKTTVGYSVKHAVLYLGWGDVATARGMWDRIRGGLEDVEPRIRELGEEVDKARADLADAEAFVQTKFANEADLVQARKDLLETVQRIASKQNAQKHGAPDVQTLILGGLGVGPVSTGKPAAPQRLSERIVSVFNDYEQKARERRRERARRMGGSMMLYTGVIPDPKRVAEAAGELADLVVIAASRAVRANLREGRPLTKLVDDTIAAINPSAAPKAKQIRGWVSKLLKSPDATEEGFDTLLADMTRPFRTKGEARAAKRADAEARKTAVKGLTAGSPGNPVTVNDKAALAASLEQQAKAAGKVQNQAASAIRRAILQSFKAGTREGWAQAGVEIGALRGQLRAAKDWADVLQAMGKRTTKNAVKDHEAAVQELRGKLVEAAKKMPPKVAKKHIARIVKVRTQKQFDNAMVAMQRTFLKLQIAALTRETIKRSKPKAIEKMRGSTEDFRKAVAVIRNDAAGTRMVAREKGTKDLARLTDLLDAATTQYETLMLYITTAKAAHQAIREMQGLTAWQIAGQVAERIKAKGKVLPTDGHEDPNVGKFSVFTSGLNDYQGVLEAIEGPNGHLKRLLIDRINEAQNRIGIMQREADEALDRAAKRAGYANANEAWNAWASAGGRGVVKRIKIPGTDRPVTLGDLGGLMGNYSDPETRAGFSHVDGQPIKTEKGRNTAQIDLTPAEIEAAIREHDPNGKLAGFIVDAKAIMEKLAPEAFQQVYLAKGVEPKHVEGYWPRVRDLSETGAAKELTTITNPGEFMGFYADNLGIWKNRTKSRAALVTINPITATVNQVHQLTTTVAMTMPIRDAAMVLLDPRVRLAAVEKIGADRYMQLVNMLAASSEVQKVYEKPSAKWVASGGQNAAIMVLGTNLKSWLSNVVGHVRNMPFMPFAAWAAGAAHMAAHPMQNMEVLFDSGYFYRRYTKTNVSRHTNLLVNPMDADLEQRFMPELERALKNVAVGDYRAAYSHVRKASSRFLDLMGWFESRTALASYFGWKSYLASKHKDWSPARVHKAALARAEANIRETQNPSEVTDSAPTAIENRGTVLAPISWMQSDRFKAYARIRRGFARSTEQGLKVLAAEVLSSAMINVGGKRIWLLVALIAATAAGDESEKRRLRKEFDNFKGDGLDVLEDIASASAPVGGQFVARVFTSMFDPQRMSASRLGEAPGIPAVDALYRAGASSAAAWTALRQSWGRRSKRDDAAVALATALNDITGALGLNPLHSITSRVLRQLKKAAE